MAYGRSPGGRGRSYNSGGGGFRSNWNREMHKIKCSECGKEAEVPFKPTEGKPVYCRECFFKKKGITPRKPVKEDEEESEEEAKEESEEEAKEESEEDEE